MDSLDFHKLIEQCDQDLRAGRGAAVALAIKDLKLNLIPRSFALPLARICRRAWLMDKGLRILTPIVRGDKKNLPEPSDEERAEYGVLLSGSGLAKEAQALLLTVDPTKVPEVNLYLAYCMIMTWDYDLAAPRLREYLLSNPAPYQKLIAQVNLASSLIALRQFNEALALTDDNLARAQELSAGRLIGNCLEMRGSIYFHLGNYAACIEALNEAQPYFSQGSIDRLAMAKWNAICQATQENDIAPLQSFREQAVLFKHWESVREADLFSLKIKFDQKKYDHLVIGSRWPKYRERVFAEIGARASDTYLLGGEQKNIFDLRTGEFQSGEIESPTEIIHQVLIALTRDFYAPASCEALFANLHPNEHFDVLHSPVRVRMAVSRTRGWLDRHQIEMEIINSDKSYFLKVNQDMSLRVTMDRTVWTQDLGYLQQLQFKLANPASFSVDQACSALGLPKTTVRRFLLKSVEAGQIIRIGEKKTTKFALPMSSKQAS